MEQIQPQDDAKKSKQWMINIGRSVTLGELLMFFAAVAFWAFSLEKRISLMESTNNSEKEEYVEFKKTTKDQYEKIANKLEGVSNSINDIKVILREKQDRK